MDVLVVNPNKVADRTEFIASVRSLAAEHDVPPPRFEWTTASDPGPGQARQAVADGAERVMVWGGDGTVVGVAEALAHTGVPLALLPGGTANLLARNLGVPLRLDHALAVAYRGRSRVIDLLDVDLGRSERRVSAVMCGAGWDAAMMAASEDMKRRFGWGAYAVEGVRQIGLRPMSLKITVDGGVVHEVQGRTVLVANVGTLVAGIRLLPEAEPDDGLLDVLVIDPTTPLDWVRTTAAIATGIGARNDPSRLRWRGRSVTVSTGHSRKRQIDGDLVSNGSSFRVRIIPQCLTVRVPAP